MSVVVFIIGVIFSIGGISMLSAGNSSERTIGVGAVFLGVIFVIFTAGSALPVIDSFNKYISDFH